MSPKGAILLSLSPSLNTSVLETTFGISQEWSLNTGLTVLHPSILHGVVHQAEHISATLLKKLIRNIMIIYNNFQYFISNDFPCLSIDKHAVFQQFLFVSYRCSCPTRGYMLNETTNACEDIDECMYENGYCQSKCENKYMDRDNISHQCSCPEAGLKLALDRYTCIGTIILYVFDGFFLIYLIIK